MSFHKAESKVSKPCQMLIKLDTMKNPGIHELEPQTGCISCYHPKPHGSTNAPPTAGVSTQVVVKVEVAAGPDQQSDQQVGMSVQLTVPWKQYAFSICAHVPRL